MAARGGKRSGAGRKKGGKNFAQAVAVDIAQRVLDEVNAEAVWKKLLKSRNLKVVKDVMIYLTDRVHGKPAQRIEGNPDKPIAVVLQWDGDKPQWAKH